MNMQVPILTVAHTIPLSMTSLVEAALCNAILNFIYIHTLSFPSL